MNIAEIQIDRFGAWRNLTLPLNRHGLTVFHGPNEAGKTTLMRFVRGMLYGFPSRPADRAPMAGSLRMITGDGECRLRRETDGSPAASATAVRGDVSIAELFGGLQNAPRGAAEILDTALQGIGETVFEHVFAVGLREVQELATLDDREVAQHIYGLTLGLEGQRLLNAWNGIRDDRQRMLDPVTNTGTLPELWAEHERLLTALNSHPDPAIRHSELATQRDRLEDQLYDARYRHAGLESQLRGHRFLDQVFGPWSRIRDHQNELKSLPIVQGFPENGVERLKALEAELAKIQQTRETLQAELKQTQKKARQLAGEPVLRQHAAAMHGFVLQRGWVGDLQSRRAETKSRLDQFQLEFEAHREQLGTDWTPGKVDKADVTAAAHHRLAGTARSYKYATLRRVEVKRACKRLSRAIKQQQAQFDQTLRSLKVTSVDDALAQARRHLDDLKSLAGLRLHEKELEERQTGIDAQLARIKPQHVLPSWVYVTLAAFCVAGAALGCWGLATGLRSSEIAGLTYVLLGLTTAGVAWGIKSQFEGDARQRITELEAESVANLRELAATHDEIHNLTASCDLSDFADDEPLPVPASVKRRTPPPVRSPQGTIDSDGPADMSMLVKALGQVRGQAQVLGRKIWKTARESVSRLQGNDDYREPAIDVKHNALLDESMQELSVSVASNDKSRSPVGPSFVARSIEPDFELSLLRQVSGRVAELEQIRRKQQQLQKSRLRLDERARRLKSCDREVQTAEQSWRDLLKQVGFPETLKVDEAFEHWRLLVETKDGHRRCQDAEVELSQLDSLWTSFRHRLEELDRRLNQFNGKDEQPLDVLTRWEAQLSKLTRQRRERVDVLKAERLKRRDLSRNAKQLRTMSLKRDALLLQGGAADREEFEFRAHCAVRRVELGRQIQESQTALQRICEQHTDLAIVEDDLRVFDPVANRLAIDTLQQELRDLDQDTSRITENLGAVRREMQLLEDDRELSRLRFDVEQAAQKLKEATEQYLALEAAAAAIDEMRTKFERTCQPRVLAMASRHLARMTGGRFTNVWTPLDKRELRIEDSRGASFHVEQLSSGTREQLFLAVRLAMIEDLGQKGIHLPVILDDVFVNFDETRAEAAAEVLLDFARQGQQVLFFTCHKHLADIFTRHGAPQVELPTREPELEVRRLAG